LTDEADEDNHGILLWCGNQNNTRYLLAIKKATNPLEHTYLLAAR